MAKLDKSLIGRTLVRTAPAHTPEGDNSILLNVPVSLLELTDSDIVVKGDFVDERATLSRSVFDDDNWNVEEDSTVEVSIPAQETPEEEDKPVEGEEVA